VVRVEERTTLGDTRKKLMVGLDFRRAAGSPAANPPMRKVSTNSPRATGRPGGNSIQSTALEENLDRAMSALGARRKNLMQTILDDSEETYFLSSRELAKRYRVDVGTIVRTTQALGYKRYADFISDLRAHFVVRMNPYTVMKAATRRGRHTVPDHIRDCIALGTDNLGAFRSEVDPGKVMNLAKAIYRARRIVIVGIDLAMALSYYFSYLLVVYGFDAEAPVGSADHLHQKVNLLGPRDLLIAISFGRCLQTTVDSVIRANERGARTFGITDGNRSPIARFCGSSMIVPTSSTELSVSYVAPVSAIEAVMTACAFLNPQRTLVVLKRKEEGETNSRWYSVSDGRPRKAKNASAE
jgi:DNA-binding MurR/RpiR family transcriptional regulator